MMRNLKLVHTCVTEILNNTYSQLKRLYLRKKRNLVIMPFILQQHVCYNTILSMFRAAPCSSSGGQIVLLQPLVSSLCRTKHLTPTYANINMKGTNSRCQRTKDAAIRFRINQEIKFHYVKKQQLNERLYKLHLECVTLWPTTWHLIQSTIDSNIQQQIKE